MSEQGRARELLRRQLVNASASGNTAAVERIAHEMELDQIRRVRRSMAHAIITLETVYRAKEGK